MTRPDRASSGAIDPSAKSARWAGFTLIEVLVVAALIALIATLAVPSISSYFQVSLGSATRELGAVVKDAYDTTLVTGQIHRVVYDLKNGQYWVEVGQDGVLLETEASRKKEEERRRLKFTQDDEEEKKKAAMFSMDKSVTSKKKSLPRGVTFEDVLTEQSKDPQTAETAQLAYTHIFPNGLTEQTLIHLGDTSEHHSTLAITPLLGRTDVFDRKVTQEDAFGK